MTAPRSRDPASYSRYSSNLQQNESIDDQKRKCREHAAKVGLGAVAPALEFADEAVSGTRPDRAGLDRLLDAARRGHFGVLVVENLSRLARESVISMPLLKELVDVLGVRVLSIDDGIDTDRTGWVFHATFMSLQNEKFIQDLSSYVFRGQEGAVLAGHCVGDLCFGYASEPVPGSETARRGRHAKPHTRYVIDPEAAPWVRRIFEWFAVEQRSVVWIARELTRLQAPKDHRATVAAWHHHSVRRVLGNTKYVGLWPWGRQANRRNPFSGKVTQEERPAEERARWDRHFPDLRIIDEPLWEAARARLEALGAGRTGRRPSDGRLQGSEPDRAPGSPRHLLAGLLRCAACGLTLQTTGAFGKYLVCRGFLTGECDCKTTARRDLAARLVVEAVATRVLSCPRWRGEVLDALRAEHQVLQDRLPDRLAQARQRRDDVRQKAERLLDLVEQGSAPPDVAARLAARRDEAAQLERAVAELERIDAGRLPEPTEAWVARQLGNLTSVLAEGAPAAALALRGLVGGRIVVRALERPGYTRGYLQARLTVRAADMTAVLGNPRPPAGGGDAVADDGPAEEIVIDLRELRPREVLADRVKGLWDQGLLIAEIAATLGRPRNLVSQALANWHEQRGLAPPDGRAHRGKAHREARRSSASFRPSGGRAPGPEARP